MLTTLGVVHRLGHPHAHPAEDMVLWALQPQLLEEWVAEQVEAYTKDRQSQKDLRLLHKSRYFDQP